TDYWGSKPPDWDKWSENSRNIKLSKQWSRTVSIARDQGLKFSPQNYLEIHYEDLISSPRETITQVVQFAEIENAQSIIDFAGLTIDPSRNKKRLQSLDENDLEEIMSVVKPTLIDLGYQ
ncbi:MAG: sulfotransferase, partial [Cyanobacteria bacterium J06621_12]